MGIRDSDITSATCHLFAKKPLHGKLNKGGRTNGKIWWSEGSGWVNFGEGAGKPAAVRSSPIDF